MCNIVQNSQTQAEMEVCRQKSLPTDKSSLFHIIYQVNLNLLYIWSRIQMMVLNKVSEAESQLQ